jgi:hypothetical protein
MGINPKYMGIIPFFLGILLSAQFLVPPPPPLIVCPLGIITKNLGKIHKYLGITPKKGSTFTNFGYNTQVFSVGLRYTQIFGYNTQVFWV